MRNISDRNPNERQPDLLDVLVVCWGVLLVLFFNKALFGSWAGNMRSALTEGLLLLLGTAYLIIRRLPITRTFRWQPIRLSLAPLMIVIAVSGAVLLDALDRLVGLLIPIPGEQVTALQQELAFSNPTTTLWVILSVAVFAPLAEESLFRGVVQQAAERIRGVTSGVMLSALIFALIHLQYWWLIQLLVLSVLLGYMAWRWQSIIPGALLHSANNLWSVWLINQQEQRLMGFYLWNGQVNPIITLVALLIFGGAFRVCDRQTERREQ